MKIQDKHAKAFFGMDGVHRTIVKNIRKWEGFAECENIAPSDSIDITIAACLHGASNQEELRSHLDYVIRQLQIFRKNIGKGE